MCALLLFNVLAFEIQLLEVLLVSLLLIAEVALGSVLPTADFDWVVSMTSSGSFDHASNSGVVAIYVRMALAWTVVATTKPRCAGRSATAIFYMAIKVFGD
jgi:hypothetical protein